MYCIISATALYSGIKQRPLAALIHFSPPLSFAGMPDSVQSCLQNSRPFRASRRLSVPVSSLVLLSLQMALSSATLLWHMRRVHGALVIAELKACRSAALAAGAQLSREQTVQRSAVACVWVECLDSDSERPTRRIKRSTAKSNSALPRKILFMAGWEQAEDGQGCCSVLSTDCYRELVCLYSAGKHNTSWLITPAPACSISVSLYHTTLCVFF